MLSPNCPRICLVHSIKDKPVKGAGRPARELLLQPTIYIYSAQCVLTSRNGIEPVWQQGFQISEEKTLKEKVHSSVQSVRT